MNTIFVRLVLSSVLLAFGSITLAREDITPANLTMDEVQSVPTNFDSPQSISIENIRVLSIFVSYPSKLGNCGAKLIFSEKLNSVQQFALMSQLIAVQGIPYGQSNSNAAIVVQTGKLEMSVSNDSGRTELILHIPDLPFWPIAYGASLIVMAKDGLTLNSTIDSINPGMSLQVDLVECN